ncbi:MAG: glycosyltransferase [Chitinivibrionia bacterium]|nr:glycosyltransferase [Chitinivibrionia bacterium]
MPAKRVLYMSGSLGLGHITRDLAIARELRKLHPAMELAWLAGSPADRLIKEAGEELLPEAADLADENAVAEQSADGATLSLIRYVGRARKQWAQNVEVFLRVTRERPFDLIIGDETYEVVRAFKKNPGLKKYPFAMIYDFVGVDAMSGNLLERLGVYMLNHSWAKSYKRAPSYVDLSLFVGEVEDVPDRSFGFMLPNRREWAKRRCQFVGHVFPFDPARYADRSALRRRLGYGDEPLVVCSIGGTAIGRPLLELCAQAYPIIREKIPDLRMVLVGGPRLSGDSLDVPAGVEVKGYVPALYEYFAASDLSIVQGGGTTTLELTALRRPFLFFPIEGHCEQEVQVAARLARHQAGIRMTLSRTPPAALADAVAANIGKTATWPHIQADGARRAAELISGLMGR